MIIEELMNSELATIFMTFPSMDLFGDIAATRQGFAQMFSEIELPENAPVTKYDHSIPAPNTNLNIPLRIYRPSSANKALPALLWIHGGGFIIGDNKMDDGICLRIAEEVGCVVVSVDYRLAPEHTFPAAPEDCYTALQWIAQSAGELGIDPQKIAVAGVSAGGCLAAAVTLMTRDRKGPPLIFQLLIYPVLDDRHTTPSSLVITDDRVWNRSTSLTAWKHYLGSEQQGEVSPYAAPTRAADFSNLPPAYILACELDLLRDEAIEYAQRLMQSGITTELHVFPGTFHGFDAFIPDAAISVRAKNEIVNALKKAIG